MIIPHWRDALEAGLWDQDRWPNFQPSEFACNHCGEFYFSPRDFDMIQRVRSGLGRPVVLSSAHRCPIWNALEGGAPLSEHKKIAFDVQTYNQVREEVLAEARLAGFTGFGYYAGFLHIDTGRPRFWWGSERGKRIWKPLLTS